MNKQEKETCSESNFLFDSLLILCDMLSFFQAVCIHQHNTKHSEMWRRRTNANFSTFNILSCLTYLVQNGETAPMECNCDIYI